MQKKQTAKQHSLVQPCIINITNIGHKFLSQIDKHFPKDRNFRKIFNRNTIKISDSCMNNTKQIMDNLNKRILHSSCSSYTNDNKDSTTIKTCNCRQKDNCPLNGNYLQSSVVYRATVTQNDNSTSETYIGLTEITSHHSATPSTKNPPNLGNTSGHSRTTTFHVMARLIIWLSLRQL